LVTLVSFVRKCLVSPRFASFFLVRKWAEMLNVCHVTEPMGLPPDVRVLGWGLSLERPTMIK
jgi:phenylalanyl-tRNA synthetase alpha chain